jgi:hypothetical protein
VSSVFFLLLPLLLPEPADWAAQRGDAALALDARPGSLVLWNRYCIAGWRGGDVEVVSTCAEKAPDELTTTAKALLAKALPRGKGVWALRAQIDAHFAASRFHQARQSAESLFVVEPKNAWALEAAIISATQAQDGPTAARLSEQGKETFGAAFEGYYERSKKHAKESRNSSDWLLLLGVVLLLVTCLRLVRRKGLLAKSRLSTGRNHLSRLTSALGSHRGSRR